MSAGEREVRRTWRAMNTDVVAIVHVPRGDEAVGAAALVEVERLFEAVEAALSRFRDASELSALNRSAGAPFYASPLLLEVVGAALDAARTTAGAFDPTILGALVAAGYDRSFERIEASDPTQALPAAVVGPARWSWRDVRLDRAAGTIALPAGCGLDLGGIGKGWTVDRAAAQLRRFGRYAIDAGGDMYVGGRDSEGRLWTVGVEHPLDPTQDLLVLALHDRAVATSTTAHRRWQRKGQVQHHLIDPRTGRPSASEVLSATVVADSTARAEVLAKAALIRGLREGLRLLMAQPDVEGMLVRADGTYVSSPRFLQYVGPESSPGISAAPQ